MGVTCSTHGDLRNTHKILTQKPGNLSIAAYVKLLGYFSVQSPTCRPSCPRQHGVVSNMAVIFITAAVRT